MVGIAFGLWTRNHPKSSRLACRISESALIQRIETDRDLRVTLGGYLVPDPYLVKFTITNLGPEDLNPSSFAGGYLRFTSPVPVSPTSDAILDETRAAFSILQATTLSRLDYGAG